jgi:hypothetical protein
VWRSLWSGTKEKLGLSACRNPKLAAVFYRLKLIEAYGTGMPKLMQAENGDYGIITTKTMIKCCGKNLPWHFCFTGRLDNGEKK